MRYCLTSNITASQSLTELGIVVISTIIFGFIERIMKEEWILYDSFMRAQKIYMKLVDELQTPTYVVDSYGKLLYMNGCGRELYEKSKKVKEKTNENANNVKKGGSNFLGLIHANNVKAVEEYIKKSVKETMPSLEVLMQVNSPLSDQPNLQEHNNVISQGYEYFSLDFKRATWKASNCTVIICERTTKNKMSHQIILQNEIQLREQLKTSISKRIYYYNN